jgi:methyl-accepting chemotaxis protein
MRWDLRTRILFIAALQLVVVAAVLFAFYYFEARQKVTQQYVEKARSVILTTESTREEMGKKWDQGVFSVAQLRAWADAGQLDKVINAVPVVTAWKAAMAKAMEGGFEFRVPKFQPRNPANEPDELEARVLKMFENQALAEHYEIDKERNAIRYFRPVKLTQECMFCHGDPKTSAELWGNDRGFDPTGTRMENWKVGDVRGAFEIIQSLDEADARIATSLRKAGMIVGALLIAGLGLFFVILTRGVIKPINGIVLGMNDGSQQVGDAAQQVSSASHQVAEGATEQASALEETASAL